jgi:AGCS family alanine or glycine:cation symporter
LGYHYASLGAALTLIVQSAFSPAALAGGAFGFTVQQAMRSATQRAVFSTESGLGTAGIFFSATGSKDPVNDSISAMLSTFISSCVCFLVGLSIVASGVWSSGLTGSPLTVSAFETVFGNFGGWIVSFLAITFGMGVLVSYAYITREAWLFLTKGRYEKVVMTVYCIAAFFGAVVPVRVIWDVNNILQAGMLFVNLIGLLYLIPVIRRGLAAYKG